jgi:glycosyltransferase involved in cell wall biosynthesis
MKLVAISRIKDEADIVEAFIRHTAWFVDHHLIIDNGSIDGTLDILAKLAAEGLKLSVFRNPVPVHADWFFNNTLLRLASQMERADWAIPLDCDEFLKLRPGVASLRAVLASADPAVPAIEIASQLYTPRSVDDASEINPVCRIVHRWEPCPPVAKVMVRADPAWAGRLVLEAGFHSVSLDQKPVPLTPSPDVSLAHFYRRSVAQEARKAVIGRLRAMSNPAAVAGNLASHYQLMFDRVKADPLLWLFGRSADDGPPVVRDPVDYRGGKLAYTSEKDDGPAQFIRILIEHGELQAASLCELLRLADPDGRLVADEMMRLERIL